MKYGRNIAPAKRRKKIENGRLRPCFLDLDDFVRLGLGAGKVET
jgi:hypothetical protein